MYLFFDTKTTGQPKRYTAPATDVNHWPRLIRLTYGFYDSDGRVISESDFIVKPNGFTIPTAAQKIHGINKARAARDGVELSTVLANFQAMVEQATYLVAHNMEFDGKVMGAEFLRKRMENCTDSKPKISLMAKSTEFCALGGNCGYKYPKLSELHYKLFKSSFKRSRNALLNIKATAECFWELKRLGKIR